MAQKELHQPEEPFVIIDQQKVYLNKEQWRVWNQFRNQVRHDARRTHSCGQFDYRKCQGDCALCSWKKDGDILYLDIWHEDEYGFLMHGMALDPVTDEVLTRDLTQYILDFADKLFANGGLLLCMRLIEGKSYAEISRTTGVAPETVRYRINKMLAEIRNNKNLFL